MFDAFVGSTANYGAEIWGYTKSKDIEGLHLKFLKRLLRVNQSTCNVFVYGELGRYPLYINRFVRIIKYWSKLQTTDNILLKDARSVSFRSELFTSYILTIFKQRNRLP